MAKQGIAYPGAFNGKLGTAVGYCWNGKWCLRSLPSQVRNPRTPLQVEHRDAFREQVRLAAHMRQAVVSGLTVEARQLGMTSYNLFVHLNQLAFSMVDGTMQVDYSLLQLSSGPVAPVAFGDAVIDEQGVLSVGFEANPTHSRANGYDGVRVYAYCPELRQGCLSAPVYRRTRSLSMALPDAMRGREVHLYGFVQNELGLCSETCYIVQGQSLTVDTGDSVEQGAGVVGLGIAEDVVGGAALHDAALLHHHDAVGDVVGDG